MRIFKKLIVLLLFFAGLLIYASYNQHPGTSITNESLASGQLSAFPHTSPLPPQIPQGAQVARSLLGLEVKFSNRNIDYPGFTMTQDPRYQALSPNEKLVDAIQFQPLQADPFLVLIAIAKSPNGAPLIVPGKFDIVRKTEQGGFVLKDAPGRVFYYSGYILAAPAWKALTPGQILQDTFCKDSAPLAMCPPKSTVNVVLKKPADPQKDIPLLVFVQ